MQNLQKLFEFLVKSPLDFVLVGGFAAVLHGCNQTTRDIDVCLALSPEQISLLRQVLAPLNPRHRMTPQKLSFMEHPRDLDGVQNLYLETDLGILDIISNVEAVGSFYDLLKNASEIEMYGGKCFLISIDDLIKSKKALGRHRDLVTVDELEAIKGEK
ncbi:MAG: nucleotidyltransferase [Deltaproteobacteria bacterium]|nr:nucleotidyltransferase [Deltaproteobacteria bacterium]